MKNLALCIAVGLGVFFIIACKKAKDGNQVAPIDSDFPVTLSLPPDGFPGETENPWAGAENEGNPYDGCGYYHNKNLDYIFANIGTDSSNLNLYNKSIAYLTSEFGSTVSGSVSSAMPSNSSLVTGVFGFVDDLSISAYQTGIGGLPVRTVVKNELLDLLEILTDTTKAYAGDFSDLKSEIISWENGLSNSLTNSEKQSLLRAGAVARYSLLYWSYYDKTLWGFLRWLGWGLVAAADAIGFGVGSSACGPYCGIALGGGASFLGFKVFKARGWEP